MVSKAKNTTSSAQPACNVLESSNGTGGFSRQAWDANAVHVKALCDTNTQGGHHRVDDQCIGVLQKNHMCLPFLLPFVNQPLPE